MLLFCYPLVFLSLYIKKYHLWNIFVILKYIYFFMSRFVQRQFLFLINLGTKKWSKQKILFLKMTPSIDLQRYISQLVRDDASTSSMGITTEHFSSSCIVCGEEFKSWPCTSSNSFLWINFSDVSLKDWTDRSDQSRLNHIWSFRW